MISVHHVLKMYLLLGNYLIEGLGCFSVAKDFMTSLKKL